MPFLPEADFEYDPDGSKEQVAVVMKGQVYREAGLTKSNHPEVEGALYDKLCQTTRYKLRNDVRKMAVSIAISVSDKEFNPTVEWLDNFMRRFCISRKKMGIFNSKMFKVKGQKGKLLDSSVSEPYLNQPSPEAPPENMTNDDIFNALGISNPLSNHSSNDSLNNSSTDTADLSKTNVNNEDKSMNGSLRGSEDSLSLLDQTSPSKEANDCDIIMLSPDKDPLAIPSEEGDKFNKSKGDDPLDIFEGIQSVLNKNESHADVLNSSKHSKEKANQGVEKDKNDEDKFIEDQNKSKETISYSDKNEKNGESKKNNEGGNEDLEENRTDINGDDDDDDDSIKEMPVIKKEIKCEEIVLDDDETSAVEEASPVKETRPVAETSPVKETSLVEETSPVEEASPVEESESDGSTSSSSDEDEDHEDDANNENKEPWEFQNCVHYSKKEDKYYERNDAALARKLDEKLTRCTACYDQVNHLLISEVFTHPVLGVLMCKKCFKFYGQGKFQKDADGYDEYCRWCANGGEMLLCDSCQNGFCKICVKRNLGRTAEKEAISAESWKCYVCEMKPLMELRAYQRKILDGLRTTNVMKKSFSRNERHQSNMKDKFAVLKMRRKVQGIASTSKLRRNLAKKGSGGVSGQEEPENWVVDYIKDMEDLLVACMTQVEKIENRQKERKNKVEIENQSVRRLLRLSQVMQENFSKLEENIREDSRFKNKELLQLKELVIKDSPAKNYIEGKSQTKNKKRQRENDSSDEETLHRPNKKNFACENENEEMELTTEGLDNIIPTDKTKKRRKEDATSNEISEEDNENDGLSDRASSKNPNGSNESSEEDDAICNSGSISDENDPLSKKNCDKSKKDSDNSFKKDSKKKGKYPLKSDNEDDDAHSSIENNTQNSGEVLSESLLKNNSATEEEKDVSETDKKKLSKNFESKVKKKETSKFKGGSSNVIKGNKNKRKSTKSSPSKGKFRRTSTRNRNNSLSDEDKSDNEENSSLNAKLKNEKAMKKLLASDSSNSEDESEVAKNNSSKLPAIVNESDEDGDATTTGIENSKSKKVKGKEKLNEKEDSKSSKELEAKAKKSLLASDSDDESSDSSGGEKVVSGTRKLTKRKKKLRKHKPLPKSVRESVRQAQFKTGAVEVNKLKRPIERELKANGFIKLKDYPELISANKKEKSRNEGSESDEELAALLKFKAKKQTNSKNDDESGSDEATSNNESDKGSDKEDSNGEKTSKKKQNEGNENKVNKKKEGLMDISLDKEEEDEEREEENEKKDEDSTNDGNPLNDKMKKALLMSSDEEAEEEEDDGAAEDIIDKAAAEEEEAKRRKKYEESKKKKLEELEEKKKKEEDEVSDVNENKNDDGESTEEEIVKPKNKKKGYVSLKFSSSEDEDNDDKTSNKDDDEDEEETDDSEDESPRKTRMFVDSDSDFELSKKSKKKTSKSCIFRSSGSDSSSEDEDKNDNEKRKSRKRIKKHSSSSDEEGAEGAADGDLETPSKKRRRHIIRDEDLLESTKNATQEEQDRRDRVKERQNLYNKIFQIDIGCDQNEMKTLVLDFDEETKKELVSINEKLVSHFKPHQASGIKFMWNATVESLDRLEKGDVGGGCILAHCMGLGKTLQVIAYIHTLLTNKRLRQTMQRVLVCCPVNTVYNWVAEFNGWLKGKLLPFDVTELISAKDLWARAYRLDDWFKEGGVCIVGYDMFRNLSNTNNKRYKGKMKEIFQKTLVSPGPDLMVCDEGHILKNEKTALSIAINKIKTMRRIILTGTPLQNNLKEYHCMIQFVKPNLLGTKKEFMNRFVHPIEAGQCVDALPRDVRRMKRRAHILHNLLEGCVQRFDYSVLKPFLPPKFEYIISVQMSEVQCHLYKYYLENLAQGGPKRTGSGLFVDFNNLARIWSHPVVLYLATVRKQLEGKEEFDEEDTDLDGFICDDDSDTSDSSEDEKPKKKKQKKIDEEKKKEEAEKEKEKEKEKEEDDVDIPGLTKAGKVKTDWWKKVLEDYGGEKYDEDEFLNRTEIAGKLVLLLDIIRECGNIGDKVLLFSQSILALNMIEEFLRMIDQGEIGFPSQEGKLPQHFKQWKIDRDYLRLDGSTGADQRKNQCKSFNRGDNERCRLFLISTRAGGVGINLVAANRVIIFDASWNPSHDTQSIFRVYRFGQRKPCYIYRFIAQGTMEEKIYSRQVTKISTSLRVVDEHQIKRYFNTAELAELYQFTPADPEERETPNVPEDRLLAEMLIRNKKWIVGYHEQDSLLENQTEEELTEEERKAAWEDFENEKKGLIPQTNRNYMGSMQFGGLQPNSLPATIPAFDVQTVIQSIIQQNHNLNPHQLQESVLLATQQIQKVHLAHYQKVQGIVYNLKNPMIAPEMRKQIPYANHPEILPILERQLKVLEDNIQVENKVITQLSRLSHGNVSQNSMMSAGLVRGVPSSSGAAASTANYVSRSYGSNPNSNLSMATSLVNTNFKKINVAPLAHLLPKTSEAASSTSPSPSTSKDNSADKDLKSAEIVTLE